MSGFCCAKPPFPRNERERGTMSKTNALCLEIKSEKLRIEQGTTTDWGNWDANAWRTNDSTERKSFIYTHKYIVCWPKKSWPASMQNPIIKKNVEKRLKAINICSELLLPVPSLSSQVSIWAPGGCEWVLRNIMRTDGQRARTLQRHVSGSRASAITIMHIDHNGFRKEEIH